MSHLVIHNITHILTLIVKYMIGLTKVLFLKSNLDTMNMIKEFTIVGRIVVQSNKNEKIVFASTLE